VTKYYSFASFLDEPLTRISARTEIGNESSKVRVRVRVKGGGVGAMSLESSSPSPSPFISISLPHHASFLSLAQCISLFSLTVSST
jgi:hypothetical protein